MFPSLNELVTYYMEMPRPPFDFVWSVALLGGGSTINTSYTSHNMRSPTSQQRGPRSPRSPQTPWMSPTSQQNTSHRTHNVAHNSHYSRGGVGGAGAMPSVFRGRRGDFEYQSEQARVSKQKAARTQAKLHIERERVKQLESQLQQERARAAQERARNDTREVQALQSEVRNLKSTVTGVDAQLAQKIQMMEQRLQSERDVVTNLTVQLREDITSAKAMRDAARKTSDRRQNASGVSSPSSPAPQSPGVFSEGGGAAEHERAVVEDLRAQLLAEKNRVRQLLSASKADRRRSSVEVDAQLAAAAAEQADAEGAAQRSKQTEEAKMRSSGLATWAMFPSLHGVAPPDFSMTETGAERAARYLANREGVVPEDTLVLEGPVKGSAAAAVAAAAGAASQTGSKSAFSYTSRKPLTVEQTIENARREAFRVKKLYDASRDGSAGRAGGAAVDVEFGFDNYENVDLQSKPRRSGGDRTSSGSGDEDRGQRMLDEHREVYGKWGDDNLQAAAMRAARDGPMRRLGKSSPPKTPQESMLEYQLRQTRLNASQQLNNSMVAAAAPQDATDWSTRVQQLVAGIDAAPSAYAAVEPLPATSGNGKHAETRHFQRIRAVMEQSRHHTEAAIKDGLLQDLDREEERLLDAIQQKTTLVGSLETQSKHVSAFLQSAQGTLGDLDLQDRTAALNILALEEALVKLGEEKDAVETELATTDVELAKVHGEKAYAKGSYEGWDAKLKTREHERRALDTALETQRQKQVMLSSDEARARAELAEEEDRMVELLSEEAQIEAILTSKEVEMAAKLANSRMAANQRNAAKQEAARRAIEEQRLLGAHEAGSGKGMMVAGGGAAPSQAQLQELLSSSIIGIDEALLDMNFGISDDMRLAAAEHHVTTLEAAYQKAQHQLVLAEDAAKLSGEYPAAMAALAAERAADEDAGRATLVSFRRDSATAQFEAGKAVYGSILDQPFANVGMDAKVAAATPVVAEENVTGFSDGSVSSWSSDAGTIVQPTSLQTSNASSIFANAALANVSHSWFGVCLFLAVFLTLPPRPLHTLTKAKN